MRFEVSKVLDAIESRLSTDPALARAVVDLAEVVRYADLDGGRPANLLRLGMVVDALGRHVAEENVPVYAVVPRAVLSDADLTSNERMVVRRWADDGLVEVLDAPGDRVLEVAELTGLPVLSRQSFDVHRARHPWLAGEPGRLLAPLVGHGGAVLAPRVPGTPAAAPRPAGPPVLGRLWRCPEPDCAAFGPARLGRPGGQPPPRLRAGAAVCPRHDAR
ncbi:MAG TPA: FHA domain-containing protein, partial [Pilimelia sp.]|nr:FHA domain-containing protein [Pilimelia sp.]